MSYSEVPIIMTILYYFYYTENVVCWKYSRTSQRWKLLIKSDYTNCGTKIFSEKHLCINGLKYVL